MVVDGSFIRISGLTAAEQKKMVLGCSKIFFIDGSEETEQDLSNCGGGREEELMMHLLDLGGQVAEEKKKEDDFADHS